MTEVAEQLRRQGIHLDGLLSSRSTEVGKEKDDDDDDDKDGM